MAITTTTRTGAPRIKPFAWSFSRLKNFEVCPKRHYEIDLAKNIKEPLGEQLQWGNYVHDSLAERCGKDRKPLPADMQMYEPWAVEGHRQHACGVHLRRAEPSHQQELYLHR